MQGFSACENCGMKTKPRPKRYTATCPKCGYSVERSKREAAEHIVAMHVGYEMCRKSA